MGYVAAVDTPDVDLSPAENVDIVLAVGNLDIVVAVGMFNYVGETYMHAEMMGITAAGRKVSKQSKQHTQGNSTCSWLILNVSKDLRIGNIFYFVILLNKAYTEDKQTII